LWRGNSGKPWLTMPTGSTVVVAEGVEDALSALVGAEIAFPARHRAVAPRPVPVSELRVIAAVSLANIGALDFPAQAARLVILAQRDPVGSAALVTCATLSSGGGARSRNPAAAAAGLGWDQGFERFAPHPARRLKGTITLLRPRNSVVPA